MTRSDNDRAGGSCWESVMRRRCAALGCAAFGLATFWMLGATVARAAVEGGKTVQGLVFVTLRSEFDSLRAPPILHD